MNTTTQIPATQNDAWGFWGTMNEHASAAWPLAMAAISSATSQPLESVRAFLDSRHGRHFADSVQNGLYRGQTLVDATNAATQQWKPPDENTRHRTGAGAALVDRQPASRRLHRAGHARHVHGTATRSHHNANPAAHRGVRRCQAARSAFNWRTLPGLPPRR